MTIVDGDAAAISRVVTFGGVDAARG